jgi:hypothetical protein
MTHIPIDLSSLAPRALPSRAREEAEDEAPQDSAAAHSERVALIEEGATGGGSSIAPFAIWLAITISLCFAIGYGTYLSALAGGAANDIAVLLGCGTAVLGKIIMVAVRPR